MYKPLSNINIKHPTSMSYIDGMSYIDFRKITKFTFMYVHIPHAIHKPLKQVIQEHIFMYLYRVPYCRLMRHPCRTYGVKPNYLSGLYPPFLK